MKKGILISAAISLALLTAYEAASIVPSTPPRAPDGVASVVASTPALGEPQTPALETAPAPLAIREAHSDGGYWYWLEK